MEENKITLTDLLRTLQDKPSGKNQKGSLSNTKETWERIGKKDSFAELGLKGSELQDFLAEWIKDNPYNF